MVSFLLSNPADRDGQWKVSLARNRLIFGNISAKFSCWICIFVYLKFVTSYSAPFADRIRRFPHLSVSSLGSYQRQWRVNLAALICILDKVHGARSAFSVSFVRILAGSLVIPAYHWTTPELRAGRWHSRSQRLLWSITFTLDVK